MMHRIEEIKVECKSIVEQGQKKMSVFMEQCELRMEEKDLQMRRMIDQIKTLKSEKHTIKMQCTSCDSSATKVRLLHRNIHTHSSNINPSLPNAVDAAKEKFERRGAECKQYKAAAKQWEKKYHEELHKARIKFQERIIQLTSQVDRGGSSAKTIQMYKDRLIQQKNDFSNEIARLKQQIAQLQERG